MNGTAAVEADPAFSAGHALIRVHGAAAFAGPFGFRIRRDDFDEGVFGPGGWQVADALLTPDARSVDGDDLLLHIGPSVVQHVVSGVYHFALPAAELETPVFWPDLPLLTDAALNIVAEPARTVRRITTAPRPQIQRRAPDESPPPVEPSLRGMRREPPGGTEATSDETIRVLPQRTQTTGERTDPEPPIVPPIEPIRHRSSWTRWAILVLLLAVLAGGGYVAYRHFYPPAPIVAQRQPSTPPGHPTAPPPPHPGPSTPPPSGSSPPDIENMTAIELARSGAAPEVLLREAQRRMQLGGPHRDDALLLMQVAADRNYAPAHAALGKFYDPDLPHPADIHPDEHQAALQYRAAVQGGDTSVAGARAALKSYLEQQARHGDVFAPQILKDFWP